MPKTLTVILGAGAPHDLIGSRVATVNEDYTPPLAKDLFTPPLPGEREAGKHREVAQAILELYPRANDAASTLALRGEQPLERELRLMAESQEMATRRQFVQIPLYLRHLFRDIGHQRDGYTSTVVNYNNLLNKVLVSDFRQVALVTTNYDMFLERALTSRTGVTFSSLSSYMSDPDWVLTKLHGSVNWVNRLHRSARRKSLNLGSYLQHLDEITRSEDGGVLGLLSDEIRVHNADDLWDSEGPLYPALVVPLEEKSDSVCPESHLKRLREILRVCPNFLIIGSSGQDEDLMELLSDEVEVASSLGIVSKDDSREVHQRFLAGVPAFAQANHTLRDGGFSSFMTSGAFDDFLRGLPDDDKPGLK